MDHSPACSAPLAPDCEGGGVRVGGWWSLGGRMVGEGLTLRMRMQRRSPNIMTRRPPLNIMERAHFFLAWRRDFQIIFEVSADFSDGMMIVVMVLVLTGRGMDIR